MADPLSHIIVKAHHPRKKQVWLALLIVCALLAGGALYEYGRLRAGFDSRMAQRQQDLLAEKIRKMQSENEALRARNAILQQASAVDRHAYDNVDQSIRDLQGELLEIKKEVAFYRGIVGAADTSKGLRIQSVMVRASGQARRYPFRLILTQYGRHLRAVHGFATMKVVGVQDGKKKQLHLSLLAPRNSQRIKFRFKYFQELQGDFELPEGFLPLRIILKSIPQGKKAVSAEKTYNWSDVIA